METSPRARATHGVDGAASWRRCGRAYRKRETMVWELRIGMKRASIILAIVAAGVCIVGLRYVLRARGASETSSLPELLKMAPADSIFVAYADVAALRQDPLVQRAAALAQPATEDRDYLAFVRATGFDYQQDLDRVMLAMEPGAAPGTM